MKLVDTVRETAGDVRIFSSLHVSGERMYFYIYTSHTQELSHKINTPHSVTECKIQTCRNYNPKMHLKYKQGNATLITQEH